MKLDHPFDHACCPFSDRGGNWQFDEEDRKGRAGATWRNEDVAESSQWRCRSGDGGCGFLKGP